MTVCRFRVDLVHDSQGHTLETFHQEIESSRLVGLNELEVKCLVCDRVRQAHPNLDDEYPDADWQVTPPSASLAHA